MTPIRIRDLNKLGSHVGQNGNGGNGNGNGNGIFNIAPPFFATWPFYGGPAYVAPATPYVAPLYEPIPPIGTSTVVTVAAIIGGAILLTALIK